MKTITDARKIERVALRHVDGVDAQLRGQVLAEANQNFGYRADAFGTAGPLARSLRDLEITPLKTEQVEQYKASKVRTVTSNPRLWIHLGLWVIPAAAMVILDVHWHISDPKFFDEWGPMPVVLGLFVAALLNAVFIECCQGSLRKTKHEWGWRTFSLGYSSNSYPRYIPVHVLNLANQIKAAHPKADFYVDELSITEHSVPSPLPDPFLWVTYAGEKFYIAVWDEREFEAKM